MAQMGNLALSGGDPRLSVDEGKNGISSQVYTVPQMRKLHDPNVSFEEYNYYANKTRAEEDQDAMDARSSGNSTGILGVIFPAKSGKGMEREEGRKGSMIAKTVNLSNPDKRAQISDDEWTNANRALRTATWGAIFYLITTDILGPFGLPYAFASMGWGYVFYPPS